MPNIDESKFFDVTPSLSHITVIFPVPAFSAFSIP
jgi:hypothetical protein